MPAVFSNVPGRISVVNGNGLAPASLTIDTDALALTSYPAITNNTIVTSILQEEATNVQFMHSLNRSIHASVFGDKIGRMVIGGMAFGSMCSGGNVQNISGLLRVQQIYRQYKMSNNPSPLKIDISGMAYSCFLTGATFGFNDPQGNIAQYSFSLASVMQLNA